jgi:hypothetical protein
VPLASAATSSQTIQGGNPALSSVVRKGSNFESLFGGLSPSVSAPPSMVSPVYPWRRCGAVVSDTRWYEALSPDVCVCCFPILTISQIRQQGLVVIVQEHASGPWLNG